MLIKTKFDIGDTLLSKDPEGYVWNTKPRKIVLKGFTIYSIKYENDEIFYEEEGYDEDLQDYLTISERDLMDNFYLEKEN